MKKKSKKVVSNKIVKMVNEKKGVKLKEQSIKKEREGKGMHVVIEREEVIRIPEDAWL